MLMQFGLCHPTYRYMYLCLSEQLSGITYIWDGGAGYAPNIWAEIKEKVDFAPQF